MRIVEARLHVLSDDAPMVMAGYKDAIAREIVLLELVDSDGAVGRSASWAPGRRTGVLVEAVTAILAEVLEDEDPALVEAAWRRGWRATRHTVPVNAPGTVDVALWDLLAKRAGLPLYRLLGGCRDRILAYASTRTLASIEEYVDSCLGFLDAGFQAIKLHPFGHADRDLRLYLAVREAVGSDTLLMADCVASYDRQGALRAGRVLDELDYYWYEEPLPDQDIDGYVDLSHKLDTPIAGIDSLRLGIGDYVEFLRRGALKIVRSDASRQGISFSRKLATIAEAFGASYEPHGYGSSLGQAANLHMAAASSTTTLMELPAPMGEFDLEVAEGLTLEDDGTVKVPTDPGLGLTLDSDRIGRYTVDSKTVTLA